MFRWKVPLPAKYSLMLFFAYCSALKMEVVHSLGKLVQSYRASHLKTRYSSGTALFKVSYFDLVHLLSSWYKHHKVLQMGAVSWRSYEEIPIELVLRQSHSYTQIWGLKLIVVYLIPLSVIQTTFFFFLVASTLGSLLPLLEHRAEFPQFLDQRQSVALLGRVISSSQGLYLYTNTEKRTHIHKH
jgi:hypothetical protein